jgi:hypothetical protein
VHALVVADFLFFKDIPSLKKVTARIGQAVSSSSLHEGHLYPLDFQAVL